jgi:hypothetical protein
MTLDDAKLAFARALERAADAGRQESEPTSKQVGAIGADIASALIDLVLVSLTRLKITSVEQEL